MKKLVYSTPKEKYGFILFPAKFGNKWDKIPDEKHLFIYYSDFEYIIHQFTTFSTCKKIAS